LVWCHSSLTNKVCRPFLCLYMLAKVRNDVADRVTPSLTRSPIHVCTDHAIDQAQRKARWRRRTNSLRKKRGKSEKGAVGHLQMRSSSPSQEEGVNTEQSCTDHRLNRCWLPPLLEPSLAALLWSSHRPPPSARAVAHRRLSLLESDVRSPSSATYI
jgi:hypothetical protein